MHGLIRAGWAQDVDVVVGGDESPSGKSEMFRIAAQRLSIPPQLCLTMVTTDEDVAAANHAHTFPVLPAVSTGPTRAGRVHFNTASDVVDVMSAPGSRVHSTWFWFSLSRS